MAKKNEVVETMLINWGGSKNEWILNFYLDGEKSKLISDSKTKLKAEAKKHGIMLSECFEVSVDKARKM